ncbi:hypothetical protein [Chryseobacterium carnipullorum]|uniref:hypothetical protein n=1 Tax=Chryseobacterium carnipullorum TaxID=1124835 RepID=UPI000E853815|nr:hypothetical protein [Chryseobacterium carnipullorum]HBV14809.1 hypothetical protein [Chryseobacterium carnipullorum]
MILRNFDFAIKYYDCKLKAEIIETSNPKINGWYKYINETLSAILVRDNNIYLLYGENNILIKKSYRVFLYRRNDTEYEFNLAEEDNILISFFFSQTCNKLNVSPFEYIDEDDFKWGVFLEKIINNEEKKINFITNLME